MTTVHDAIIERGVQFLVIFCPLAFGTVHPWAAAVMELIAFLMLGAWMLKCAGEGQVPVPRTASLVAAVAFVLLVAAQLVPLPGGLLQAFSPRTAEALAAAGIADDGVWRPLSLQPQATREGLFALFAYVAVFLVVTQHYRTTKQVRRTVDTVLAVAVVLVLFAVLQKMTWNGRLYWVFPVSPGIESDLNYIWGPYINRNHFAGYLEIAAPLGMGLFLHQIASRLSGQGRRDGRTVIRLLSSGLRSRTVFITTLIKKTLLPRMT